MIMMIINNKNNDNNGPPMLGRFRKVSMIPIKYPNW